MEALNNLEVCYRKVHSVIQSMITGGRLDIEVNEGDQDIYNSIYLFIQDIDYEKEE